MLSHQELKAYGFSKGYVPGNQYIYMENGPYDKVISVIYQLYL